MAPMPERDELPEPGTTTDERTMLVEFLDYFRAVLERKVDGLDEAQARMRVGASTIDLLGLVRHMAEVERWWFRQALTGEVDHGIYEDPDDVDADWHHTTADTLPTALSAWRTEVAHARANVAAAPSLDVVAAHRSGPRGEISLRWIMVHMIEEYARHCGHADFLREVIDGRVGD